MRNDLNRMDEICLDHALIPCRGKAPIPMNWQKPDIWLGLSPIGCLHYHPRVTAIGLRTSEALFALDFDGHSTHGYALACGIDPFALTWTISRTGNEWRLKQLWRTTPEQRAQLPYGPFSWKHVTQAALKDDNGKVLKKGEALEVFASSSRQVIVLGRHPDGDDYYWREGKGPEALAVAPDALWNWVLTMAAAAGERRPSERRQASTTRRLDPCPICGRHSRSGSALWCSTDGDLIWCMPGVTFNAEMRHGSLRVGHSVVNGYALVKRTLIEGGDCLTFRPHVERMGAQPSLRAWRWING